MAHPPTSELDLTPNAYSAGMFHPVYAGEVYNNRYRVLHKLGYGVSATVWLVKDITTNRFLAMKVISADCSGALLQEVEILLHLQQADPAHPGHSHITPLMDHFEHSGPNGQHKCLVFPVLAESLETFSQRFEGGCLPGELVKRVIKQLLLALDYAHEHGVMHTDIKPDNIMVVLKDEAIIEAGDPLHKIGDISQQSARSRDDSELNFLHFPNGDRIQPWEAPIVSMVDRHADFESYVGDLFDFDIMLADWGVATWVDPHRRFTNNIAPLELQSPELIIRAAWDNTVDIWQLGCLTISLLERASLFSGIEPIASYERGPNEGCRYDAETHLMQICDVLGPFPTELLNEGDPALVNYCFHANGWTTKEPSTPSPQLHDWITRLQQNEKNNCLAMLQAMLAIDPVARVSARALLEYPWMSSASADVRQMATADAETDASECKHLHGPYVDDDCSSNSSSDSDDSAGTDITNPSLPDDLALEDDAAAGADHDATQRAFVHCDTTNNDPMLKQDVRALSHRGNAKATPLVLTSCDPSETHVSDLGHAAEPADSGEDHVLSPSVMTEGHESIAIPAADDAVGAISSEMLRLLDSDGFPLTPDQRRSRGFGVFEGKTHAEIVYGALWFCKELVKGVFSLLT